MAVTTPQKEAIEKAYKDAYAAELQRMRKKHPDERRPIKGWSNTERRNQQKLAHCERQANAKGTEAALIEAYNIGIDDEDYLLRLKLKAKEARIHADTISPHYNNEYNNFYIATIIGILAVVALILLVFPAVGLLVTGAAMSVPAIATLVGLAAAIPVTAFVAGELGARTDKQLELEDISRARAISEETAEEIFKKHKQVQATQPATAPSPTSFRQQVMDSRNTQRQI